MSKDSVCYNFFTSDLVALEEGGNNISSERSKVEEEIVDPVSQKLSKFP